MKQLTLFLNVGAGIREQFCPAVECNHPFLLSVYMQRVVIPYC